MIGSLLLFFKEQNRRVAIAYITNGEGGKILGSPHITDPATIAEIRKNELEAALQHYGVHDYIQLGEPDVPLRDPVTGKPTRSGQEFLSAGVWNVPLISGALEHYAAAINPSLVIAMSMDEGTHGHHKAIRIITENLFLQHKLGPRAKSLYAIEENYWVTEGQSESRDPHEIVFDSSRLMETQPTSYSEHAFMAAANHRSQAPGHTGPIGLPDAIYKVQGETIDLNIPAPVLCDFTFQEARFLSSQVSQP